MVGAVTVGANIDSLAVFQTKKLYDLYGLVHGSWKHRPPHTHTLCLSLSLRPTASSTPGMGPIFNHNERREHAALHRTQMGPQRVPDQFFLDKGRERERDVYRGDEM